MSSIFAVDPDTSDLVRLNGAFVRRSGEDVEQIVQAVRERLRAYRGENPWALGDGTRWDDLIFVKGTPAAVVEQHLRAVIMGTPGIVTLDTFTLTNDPSDPRTVQIDWTGTATLADYLERTRVSDSFSLTG